MTARRPKSVAILLAAPLLLGAAGPASRADGFENGLQKIEGRVLSGFKSLSQRPRASAAPAPESSLAERLRRGGSLDDLIARQLGMRRPYRVEVEARHLEDSYNNVDKVVFDDGRREVAVAVKSFSGSFLDRSKRRRYRNEVDMNAAFAALGLQTLQFVVVVPNRKITVTRFLEDAVKGDALIHRAARGDAESLALVARLGADLATAHRHHLCVGDFHIDNFMASRGEIIFSDMDKAQTCAGETDPAWDIAKFLYSAGDHTPLDDQKPVLDAFFKGYFGNGGSPEDAREAASNAVAAMIYKNAHLKQFIDSYPATFQRIREGIREAGNDEK